MLKHESKLIAWTYNPFEKKSYNHREAKKCNPTVGTKGKELNIAKLNIANCFLKYLIYHFYISYSPTSRSR